MNTTIAIFNLVQDDLKQVERTMREEPILAVGSRSFVSARKIRDSSPHPALNDVISHLVASGGKRVRPALALLVSYIYPAMPATRLRQNSVEPSVESTRGVVFLAAAVELLHTATLVHDDLIDGALLRRGNPTLNATCIPSATVLIGDYLFARAADLAARTDSVRVMRLFARALMIICNGEINQMFDKRIGLDRQKYYDRIYAKTAALFAVAAEASGVLGKAPKAALTALREYGEQLGMAFQIVDDVLDFVGDEAKLGKPVGNDLRAGLVTLPTLWFLEQNEGHELIGDILDNGRRDETSIQTAVRTICESGAIEGPRWTRRASSSGAARQPWRLCHRANTGMRSGN